MQLADDSLWQSTWQLKVDFAEHWPLQLPWHLASQLAVGGVPVQLLSHLASQFALQDAEQRPLHAAESESEAHLPSHALPQSAVQPPLQLAWQSKLPAFASHLALHSDSSHLPVHSADAEPEHLPSQLTSSLAAHCAWKLIGVHFAVQPPWTSAVHFADAST